MLDPTIAFIAGSLLTALMLFPLWGIHSILRKWAQKNDKTQAG